MLAATKTYSDTELLHALTANSEAAFQLLYNRYWEKIYSVTILYLKDNSIAEDIVQETFLKIWKKRAELPEINNFQHYLHVVARNLIISMLRKKMPICHAALETSHSVQEESWKPSQQLENKEIEELIQKAINQLSPKQKQIYLLSSEKQLSLKDLAISLNITYNTARQYKSEALKQIRCYLKANASQLQVLALMFYFQ